uniref:Carboxylesterase type B domain-containing protein n=1 Tax=Ditylenchus dipsaci TaxID=166011 RepID=A0A915DZ61_9BILA
MSRETQQSTQQSVEPTSASFATTVASVSREPMDPEEEIPSKSVPFYKNRRIWLIVAVIIGLLVLVGVLVLVLLLTRKGPEEAKSEHQKSASEVTSSNNDVSSSYPAGVNTTSSGKSSYSSTTSTASTSYDPTASTTSGPTAATELTVIATIEATTTTTEAPPVNNEDVNVIDSLETAHKGKVVVHKRNLLGLKKYYGNGVANVFLGVPYAQRISEKSRYDYATNLEKEAKNYNRSAFGNFCLQPASSSLDFLTQNHFDDQLVGVEMSDDCLTANIFAPYQRKVRNLYPVYVHFHGGFLVRGSSAELGDGIIDTLVARGILVVTLNYRLGPAGFLEMPGSQKGYPKHSKNRGLYDQMVALTWIRQNIGAFGGDPDKITIGGQGSGACTAELIATSEDPDLMPFKRVILQSGTLGMCMQNSYGHQEQSSGQLFIEKECHDVNWDSWVSGDIDVLYESAMNNCVKSLDLKSTSKLTADIPAWELSLPDSMFKFPANPLKKKKLEVLMGVSDYAFASYDLQLRNRSDFLVVVAGHSPPAQSNDGRSYVESALEKICENWKPVNFEALLTQMIRVYKFSVNKPSNEWFRFYLKSMTDSLIATRIGDRAKQLASAGNSVIVYRFVDDGSAISPSAPPSGAGSEFPYEVESSYLFLPRQVWGTSHDKKVFAVAEKLAENWANFILNGKLDGVNQAQNRSASYVKISKGEVHAIEENGFLSTSVRDFWYSVKSKAGIKPNP